MSLQFIFGPSGAGKSQYIYNQIIQESIDNLSMNYILLVPEQYSMALQRKMVTLHPNGGTMNIDVIGFNRLTYRVFDELNVKPQKVLEDFGKTMLIRQVAGNVKKDLTIYGGTLNKSGFIDEVKSLMSEMFQYDVSREKLLNVIEGMEDTSSDTLLYKKLKDMLTIFQAFDDKIKDEYIVAEQLTEILAGYIEKSELISNSVIVMDGFTGFTPIQYRLIVKLIKCAKKVYMVLDMDSVNYSKKKISEHELFYLSSETKNTLLKLAEDSGVSVDKDIFIGSDGIKRWDDNHGDLAHLEGNIFRYPYKKYKMNPDNIMLSVYDNPRKELMGIAGQIRQLIMDGYRYKDIAVITGDFEGVISYVEQIMPQFDIPYFLDYSRPIKNNPYIDAIESAIRIVDENFSYDSVFAFLKSGILYELTDDEIEALENYVLARGIRGYSLWKRKWNEDVDEIREYFIDKISRFYESLSSGKVKVCEYVEAIYSLMDTLEYEKQMSDMEDIYGKLISLFEKMLEIMPEDYVELQDFYELMMLGIKDLSLGVIPGTLDMVVVGDITRTRLDEIKVLFILGVNDGIIPKKGDSTCIISDYDKEALSDYGLFLAPTNKLNAYIEQFYLYINMTKPKDKLYISYTLMNRDNVSNRPSYIISRIKNIFPELKENVCRDNSFIEVGTRLSTVDVLIKGIKDVLAGDVCNEEEVMNLYRLYISLGEDKLIKKICEAINYNNIPKSLTKSVADLIKLRLMSQSVSRLEQFSKCAYSYYLKYTIGLKERDTKGIDNRNLGNILHSALEKMFRYVHDMRKNEWNSLDDNERDLLISGFVEQAYDKEYEGQILDDGRYEYLKNMLVRVGKRSVKALSGILNDDKLVPEYFEHRFEEKISLGESDEMTLRGIVDRGDVYYSEEDKVLRLRIIDYKSSEHDFDIIKLYDGVQLQLSVYMEIMKALAHEVYKVDVIPDGMYYYKMHDPIITIKNNKVDDANIEKERSKNLKLKGLANSNTDYFNNITKYSMKKVENIAKTILEGEISKSPLVGDLGPACNMCPYSFVCRFDEKNGGNKLHYPKYKKEDKELVYKKIVEELGGDIDGMD